MRTRLNRMCYPTGRRGRFSFSFFFSISFSEPLKATEIVPVSTGLHDFLFLWTRRVEDRVGRIKKKVKKNREWRDEVGGYCTADIGGREGGRRRWRPALPRPAVLRSDAAVNTSSLRLTPVETSKGAEAPTASCSPLMGLPRVEAGGRSSPIEVFTPRTCAVCRGPSGVPLMCTD